VDDSSKEDAAKISTEALKALKGSFKSAAASPRAVNTTRRRKHQIDLNVWPSPLKYNRRSLQILTLQNPIRRAFIAAIEWPWWDRTVLFVILVNTISLLCRDPYDIPAFFPDSPTRIVWDTLSTVIIKKFTMNLFVELICGLADIQLFLSV
jgi:hypothetical protein